MVAALVALGAGLVLAVGLLRLWERDSALRSFWTSRLLLALTLGVVLWKLTPLWTRWDAVLDNPLLLLSMNGGLAALTGGLFAGAAVLGLSVVQSRRERPGSRRWPLPAAALAGLVLGLAVVAVEPLVVPRPGSDPGPALQTLVPDLGGRTHALADYRGRLLVVNFWATWCTPCLAELPEFAAWTKKGTGRAQLLGVNLLPTEKGGEKAVLAFATRHRLTWTQLTDPEGTLAAAFAVTAVPTTVVLDPQGRVVDRREGAVDLFWLQTLEARFAR